jgi:hypothetical protein
VDVNADVCGAQWDVTGIFAYEKANRAQNCKYYDDAEVKN